MTTFSEALTFTRSGSATYVDSTGTLQTAADGEPRIGHHVWDGSQWVNKGLLLESESRTNLFLNSDTPETQAIPVTDGETYTVSFKSGPSVVDLDETKADTAVDVFVYDTSRDSDGGAWRTGALAQASSWYNETLNTSTRGSRREFPAVAVIVAEADTVTIYDGDDPALPMWMVFSNGAPGIRGQNAASSVSAVSMRNGLLVAATSGAANEYQSGLPLVNFLSDRFSLIRGAAIGEIIVGTVEERNSASSVNGDDSIRIASGYINDVAMTVLPDAPVDPATGLPVPTIAVATDGGVSVIRDDGTVVDLNTGQAGYSFSPYVYFRDDDAICFSFDNSSSGSRYHYVLHNVPSSDLQVAGLTTLKGDADEYYVTASGNTSGDIKLPTGDKMLMQDNAVFGGNSGSLMLLSPVKSNPSTGMVAHITSDYNTGWMNGDIKGAFLSDTDDTDLVGGTDADRSVNGNDLTVNGTVTRSPVATGADLVACSGFSTSNYLEQPYNPDLDFGTGDFCVMGWINAEASGFNRAILDRSAYSGLYSGAAWRLRLLSGGNFQFQATDDAYATSDTLTSTKIGYEAGNWVFFAVGRSGSNLFLSVNGEGLETAVISAAAGSLSNTSATLLVGKNNSGSGDSLSNGSLALLRISATAPTAEQIAKIYEDEKVLFQENAQATLYGTSDAVTALAHDPDTDLLHVGTSAGRSVFYGLRRINNTTTGVTTAISAADGVIAEQ